GGTGRSGAAGTAPPAPAARQPIASTTAPAPSATRRCRASIETRPRRGPAFELNAIVPNEATAASVAHTAASAATRRDDATGTTMTGILHGGSARHHRAPARAPV